VFRVPITLARILDLTDPVTIEAMGAKPIEEWILSPRPRRPLPPIFSSRCPTCKGCASPRWTFLDHPDRANLVVYRDRIDLAMSFGEPVHLRDVVLETTDAPDQARIALRAR